ncbi:MAG TPA: NADH-quinone oxidoreductase subunit L [Terriglobales bacterium]|nr:NADH-quinone oxidoreductase subunit L [Terriglobales bacterium]
MNLHLVAIPLLPLAGAAINGLLGKRFPRTLVATVALAFTAASFLWAVWAAIQFADGGAAGPYIEHFATWMQIGNFQVEYGFYLDHLSMVMMLIVTGVGFLIHVYSVGYMWEEGGFYRFFCYLNLFMFFMLTLVLASNYLQLFVGWEGVGLASYLLIGFFFWRDSAAAAGKKAFIVNRIGDFTFLIGLFLLIKHFGTLDFASVFSKIGVLPTGEATGLLTAIALMLLGGACGKSAQLPLYVWLPDAMEGPTPVSALIHAATMVTAGVYMIARSHAIFDRAPMALLVVAIIGCATALFAATIGLVQHDIKRVLAYSTVSQLGYMVLACGVAAYSAALFHLMTHAFFKALLFLGAGSVIHALGGEQDMRRMGGLRKKIPWTFWSMTFATLAIAGAPPFAGFFSKDEILWRAFSSAHGSWVFWLIGLITAGLTSFYMFRLWFLTFFGDFRGAQHEEPEASGRERHASDAASAAPPGHGAHGASAAGGHGHGHDGVHESPPIMLVPLVILAILSLVGGWVGIPAVLGGGNHFEKFLAPVFEAYATAGETAPASPAEPSGPSEMSLSLAATGAALVGFLLAWWMYHRRPELHVRARQRLGELYRVLDHKYWIDEIYGAVFVRPLIGLSRAVLWRGVDAGVIDGTVNGSATAARELSDSVRHMQSGNIRSYAGWVAAGAACVLVYMIWLGMR